MVRKIQKGYNNFVDVIGPVKLPGQYEIKSGDRILDIIKRAEGVLYDVFDSRAYIIRLSDDMSKRYIPFSLKTVLSDSSSPENIKLQNFDIIKIFSKSYFKDEFTFEVLGAVRNPGSFVYGEGLTLKDALYLAGRLKKEALRTRIEISRAIDFDKSSKKIFPIRALIKTIQIGNDLTIDKSSEEFLIQPYDQILIRTDPDFELQKNVVLQGEVVYPGVYTLLSKDEKISNVIKRAGGVTNWGFPEGAKLVRKEYNAGPIVLKLDDVLKDSTSKYNYILRAGDSLTIPKTIELIKIMGRINYPDIDSIHQINAPYSKGKKAKYYINNYGLGFTKEADKSRTYITTAGGVIKRTRHFLFIKTYPKVPKGSTIMVLERKKSKSEKIKKGEPIDWNTAIEKGTVKLTALITVYLLFSRITIK
jgi:protein involved in polysaccharide export with SLBB domain